MEASLNDDDAIEISGISEGQTETNALGKVVQKQYIPLGEVSEIFESTVVPESYFKNLV